MLCQSHSEDYVLPGSILWTGVAMLMSCRCSRVSVWKRRSVEPELKAIHMPTPATTMCDTTMPSSWWASNCLWRRRRWHEFLVIYCRFTGTETEGTTWRPGVHSSRDAITDFNSAQSTWRKGQEAFYENISHVSAGLLLFTVHVSGCVTMKWRKQHSAHRKSASHWLQQPTHAELCLVMLQVQNEGSPHTTAPENDPSDTWRRVIICAVNAFSHKQIHFMHVCFTLDPPFSYWSAESLWTETNKLDPFHQRGLHNLTVWAGSYLAKQSSFSVSDKCGNEETCK